MEKCNGQNTLHSHAACLLKAPSEVIVTIVEIGGCQLVLEKNSNGSTASHYAIWQMVSTLKKFIEIGGRELVMVKSVNGSTSLHRACRCPLTSTEVFMLLIEVVGQEIVMEKDNHGSTSLHFACEHHTGL